MSPSSASSSGNAGQGHQHGVAGPPLHLLLDEVEVQAGGGLLADRLGHPGGAVADDHHGPLEVQLGQGVQDVQHHGPPAQPVQRLGPLGAHPGALPGSQDDRRQRPHFVELIRRVPAARRPLTCPLLARHAPVLPTPVCCRLAVLLCDALVPRWRVVQLAEHRTLDPDVAGSSPAPPATRRLPSSLPGFIAYTLAHMGDQQQVSSGESQRSPLGTFACCPFCSGQLHPEHAHFRCRDCGWRDSCCD